MEEQNNKAFEVFYETIMLDIEYYMLLSKSKLFSDVNDGFAASIDTSLYLLLRLAHIMELNNEADEVLQMIIGDYDMEEDFECK